MLQQAETPIKKQPVTGSVGGSEQNWPSQPTSVPDLTKALELNSRLLYLLFCVSLLNPTSDEKADKTTLI